MGDVNIDKLKEAAEKVPPTPWDGSPQRCHLGPELVAVRAFIAAADPTTILDLIARLKAAKEVIAAQHKGLREWESECRLGMMGDEGEAALAKHTAYRKEYPDAE